MSILNKIDNSLIGERDFIGHPVSSLLLEEKILYLQAMSLIMNVGGIIEDSEKFYIVLLIRSFKLDFSIINMLIDFSNDPDEKSIIDFFDVFSNSVIRQNFLFDALMMFTRITEINENFIDSKILAIRKMSDGLKIPRETRNSIKELLMILTTHKSELFFSKLKDENLSESQFSYLGYFYEFKS